MPTKIPQIRDIFTTSRLPVFVPGPDFVLYGFRALAIWRLGIKRALCNIYQNVREILSRENLLQILFGIYFKNENIAKHAPFAKIVAGKSFADFLKKIKIV